MIRVENATKIFRTEEIETQALNNVSLHIKKGEFVSIMGPSGCGKSTLLSLLGLIDTPSQGKIHFMGKNVSNYSEDKRSIARRGNIGFVFQSFNLIDELTVYENIELPLLYMKINSSERKKRINDLLERMNMHHRKKHFPQQLSGGQQQRAAVLRAIVANPEIILADEPTGNLDSKNGEKVMKILTELNKDGTTIIMVSHSPAFAAYAGRTVHLFDGQIVLEDTPEAHYV